MSYRYSQLDKSNLDWFDKDTTRATLLGIEFRRGSLRGLKDIHLQFRYPITAISGKNGTGKSTILACAACGYHNVPSGFKPLARRTAYYTFSDFFVQSAEEVPPSGIVIGYYILHNKWNKSARVPTGVGVGFQARHKGAHGRWNNYDSRVSRNVVFLGIERVCSSFRKKCF
jgi:energy-coupling factor transporter ATP-binding protein EcfA2